MFEKCQRNRSLKPNLHVAVRSSSSVPVISLGSNNPVIRLYYKNAFEQRLFGDATGHHRFLPAGNISLEISLGDKESGQPMSCKFASSAPEGRYSVFNFQAVNFWSERRRYPPPLPWSQRKAKPIFRGLGWGTDSYVHKIHKDYMNDIRKGEVDAGDRFYRKFVVSNDRKQRFALIHFSSLHPDLVDARLSGGANRPRKWHPIDMWEHNATNGLHRLLPFDPIPEEEYYSEYQVHLVLGGIGAAFRLARILEQGIAVVLQDYPYKEWFTRLMVPFVHYIPLDQKLSNLNETLYWVRENPSKVFEIAVNGKAFHEKYLSYERMADFYHELLFRLMLCCASH